MPFAAPQFKYDHAEIIGDLMRQVNLCSMANLHPSLFLSLSLSLSFFVSPPCIRAKCVSAYRVGEQSNGQEVEREKG